MPVERVPDVDDPRLADYRELRDSERRRREGTFVAESRQVVRRLLGGSRFRARSLLATETALDDLRDVVDERLPVYLVDEPTIRAVAGFNFHRGCIAVGERGSELEPSALDGGRLVVLERVTNPDNVGGVFRNAMAFGADGVLLSPGCADPLYRKAIRVSMGGTLVVPFAHAADWPGALTALRDRGFTVIALALDGGLELRAVGPVPERVALLVGAEGEGLAADTRAMADVTVRIPMAPGGHSLNVATAAAIALHHVLR